MSLTAKTQFRPARTKHNIKLRRRRTTPDPRLNQPVRPDSIDMNEAGTFLFSACLFKFLMFLFFFSHRKGDIIRHANTQGKKMKWKARTPTRRSSQVSSSALSHLGMADPQPSYSRTSLSLDIYRNGQRLSAVPSAYDQHIYQTHRNGNQHRILFHAPQPEHLHPTSLQDTHYIWYPWNILFWKCTRFRVVGECELALSDMGR